MIKNLIVNLIKFWNTLLIITRSIDYAWEHMTTSSGKTSSFAYQLNNILVIEDLDIFPIKNNWKNNHKSTERQQCVVKQHFIDIDAFAQTMIHDVCTLAAKHESWHIVSVTIRKNVSDWWFAATLHHVSTFYSQKYKMTAAWVG